MTRHVLNAPAAFEQARAVDTQQRRATRQSLPAAPCNTSRPLCPRSRRSTTCPSSSPVPRFRECRQQEHPGPSQSNSITRTITMRSRITTTRTRILTHPSHPHGMTLHNSTILLSGAGMMTCRHPRPLHARLRQTTRTTTAAPSPPSSRTSVSRPRAALKIAASTETLCIRHYRRSTRCP